MTPKLESMILLELRERHLGPGRAIPRDQLMSLFGIDPKDVTQDRRFREWYSDFGIPVCEHGLYIPRGPADVDACARYLWPKMDPKRHGARMQRIYLRFPHCSPERGEQLELRIP